MVDNLLEGAEGGHLGSVDLGKVGGLFTHGGEDLDALDGVDTEVGLHVHVELEHVGGVSGLLRHHLQHQGLQTFEIRSRGRGGGGDGSDLLGRRAGWDAFRHMVDDLLESAEGGHLGGVDLGKVGGLFAHGGEDLDALDGVDTEVGLHVHVELEHLRGISRLLGHHVEHEGA